jgi:MraZ protein
VFYSTASAKTEGGRLVLPSGVRDALGTDKPSLFVFQSTNGPLLECAGWEDGLARVQQAILEAPLEQRQALQRAIFPRTQRIDVDAKGRASFLPEMLRHCGVTTEALFVGAGAYFEIWNPQVFEASQKVASDLVSSASIWALRPPGAA